MPVSLSSLPVLKECSGNPTPGRITPDDLLSFKSVSDAQFSPDGTRVAFVLGDSYKFESANPKSRIWMVSVQDLSLRPLSSGNRTDNLPRWSPDGKTLAFASDRLEDGQKQIYLLPVEGGEAQKLTDIRGPIPTPRGLNSLQWSPDGKLLAFLKEDEQSAEERFRHEQKDDAIEFEKHPKYVRLWVVDVGSGKARCVSPGGLQIWEFAWSPDSQHFAATVSELPYEWAWYHNQLVRFPLAGGAASRLFESRYQVALPRWSPDGCKVAFLCSFWSDRGVTAGDIWTVPALGGEARNLSAGIEASFGWMEWQADSRSLVAVAHERGMMSLSRLDVSGGERSRLWQGEVTIAESFWPRFSMAAGPGNARGGAESRLSPDELRLAVVREDASHPRDLWVAKIDGAGAVDWVQLTQLHPQAAQLELGNMESIRWKGAGGLEMQGLLVYPVNYQTGDRVPLVTWVHGGPVSAATFRYATDGYTQLLAASGMAVFLPNYRGSVGRGLAFVEANIGDLGGRDFQDILLGVDHCIQIGVADPERLGIGGWSYGGFMTAWAITQTPRFRAAVMGAGISNWLSFHGNSILNTWDAMHLNASPYEANGTYRRYSPIHFVTQVKTPTLILHGEKDWDVPPEQSYQFYRALRDLKVETELVIYPREGHGPNEKMHLRDLMHRVPGWFQKHLAAPPS